MYDYIKGRLVELNPTDATVESYGIGYHILLSLSTFTRLQPLVDTDVKLFLLHIVREDDEMLYGFFDKNERYVFTQLISVSGIGHGSARMLLSAMTADEVRNAIVNQDVNKIKSAKGIGLKTAQRVILELKDKIGKGESTEFKMGQTVSSPIKEEATSALILLGFAKPAVEKTVSSLIKSKPDIKLEELIKSALKIL